MRLNAGTSPGPATDTPGSRRAAGKSQPGRHAESFRARLSSAMDRITRVTVVYDPEEDRLALDVENQHQARRRLWLTRRLLDQLIPALLQPLCHSTASVAQPPTPCSARGKQVYAQLAARLQHKPARPVSPPGAGYPGPGSPGGPASERALATHLSERGG